MKIPKIKLLTICPENIEFIKRLGAFQSNRSRPIFVELNSKRLKREILSNAKLLKGSKVYIEEDFSRKVTQERKILKPQLLKARNEGYKATLHYNILFANGTAYKCSDFAEETEGIANSEPGNAMPQLRRKSISLIELSNVENEQNEEEETIEVKDPITINTNINTAKNPKETQNSVSTPKSLSKIKRQKDIQKTGPLDKHIFTRSQSNSSSKNLDNLPK